MKNFRKFDLMMAFLLGLLLSANAFGLPGELDTTFSADGIVQSPSSEASTHRYYCYGTVGSPVGFDQAIQNDGKIVVASSTPSYDITVRRYNSDGSTDPSFGISGKVLTDVPGINMIVGAMAFQPDGTIVVVGGNDFKVVIIRYRANGAIDTIAAKDISDYGSEIYRFSAKAVTIQPDGRILVAGRLTKNIAFPKNVFSLMRFQGNGLIDSTFDSDGLVYFDDSSGEWAAATAVHYQASTNKIIATGAKCSPDPSLFSGNHFTARYYANGSPDRSFRFSGTVTTMIGNSHSSLVEPDGKIVIAGDQYLEKLRSDGRIWDIAFGSLGRVRNWDFPMLSVRRQVDGKYLVAGIEQLGTLRRPILRRYNPNGTPDPTFGSGGLLIINRGIPMDITVLTLQSDGKILLGGVSGTKFTLFRLLAY